MKNPLVIILIDNNEVIINEDQVCSICRRDSECTTIYMSNGQTFECKSPAYQEWKNDLLSKPIV